MIKVAKNLSKIILDHPYGFVLFVFLVAAALTGIACVIFMRSFEFVLARRLDFKSIGYWCILTTPMLFLFSIELIRRVSPCAAGTGIPQVIFAVKHSNSDKEQKIWPLVSPRTMAVKILAILIGVYAGASSGREGPTVHIATCIFIMVMLFFRRFTGLSFDMRSAIVAGGAAGLASAFNTPLAGVTFAIEELTTEHFTGIKEYVLMAIIVAAISARFLTGEYSYFGRLLNPLPVSLSGIVIIGLSCGVLGAFFSSSILNGQKFLSRFKNGWSRILVPILLAFGLLIIAALSHADVMGPGNLAAQAFVRGNFGNWAIFFPLEKIFSTLFTYWSGIAGGIFAPCLSIGAAIGSNIGDWMGMPISSCAMIGMAAFLSGTIQAPITSFVIIFEMTSHHELLLPIMLSSLLSFMVTRLLGAKHLYQTLAANYNFLIND